MYTWSFIVLFGVLILGGGDINLPLIFPLETYHLIPYIVIVYSALAFSFFFFWGVHFLFLTPFFMTSPLLFLILLTL